MLASRVLPQECHLVIDRGEIAGRVTSIAFSPTLRRYIGWHTSNQNCRKGNRCVRLSDGSLDSAVSPTPSTTQTTRANVSWLSRERLRYEHLRLSPNHDQLQQLNGVWREINRMPSLFTSTDDAANAADWASPIYRS